MSVITITDAGRNMIRDSLSGANTAKITFVALGSSTAGIATNDTQLGNEKFRKAVTSYSNGANAGEIIINLFLAPGDAVGLDIEEVGFFGGSNASTVPNSGVLLAHGSYVHNPKGNGESIEFSLDFTI